MPPTIHYVAHGSHLAFPCYWRALRRHLDSRKVIPASGVPGHYRHEYPVKPPARHSSLSKITCPECWGMIRKMADRAIMGGQA